MHPRDLIKSINSHRKDNSVEGKIKKIISDIILLKKTVEKIVAFIDELKKEKEQHIENEDDKEKKEQVIENEQVKEDHKKRGRKPKNN